MGRVVRSLPTPCLWVQWVLLGGAARDNRAITSFFLPGSRRRINAGSRIVEILKSDILVCYLWHLPLMSIPPKRRIFMSQSSLDGRFCRPRSLLQLNDRWMRWGEPSKHPCLTEGANFRPATRTADKLDIARSGSRNGDF